MTDRLYGLPGAEIFWTDPAVVWESEIEPYADPEMTEWLIEEWTVHHPSAHLPDADVVAEWLAECGADNQELDGSADAWVAAVAHPESRDAINAMLSTVASHVHYWTCKQKVETHLLTLVDGEPHLDGEPLYRKAQAMERMDREDKGRDDDDRCEVTFRHLECVRPVGHPGDHQSTKGFVWFAEGDNLVRCMP